jgi:adenine specific DNA methylase Mod
MRPRCVELHRVLKKTGSFYYHCDWPASHYVKQMLDQIFGQNQFLNEIVWKRTGARSDAKRQCAVATEYERFVLGRNKLVVPNRPA